LHSNRIITIIIREINNRIIKIKIKDKVFMEGLKAVTTISFSLAAVVIAYKNRDI